MPKSSCYRTLGFPPLLRQTSLTLPSWFLRTAAYPKQSPEREPSKFTIVSPSLDLSHEQCLWIMGRHCGYRLRAAHRFLIAAESVALSNLVVRYNFTLSTMVFAIPAAVCVFLWNHRSFLAFQIWCRVAQRNVWWYPHMVNSLYTVWLYSTILLLSPGLCKEARFFFIMLHTFFEKRQSKNRCFAFSR